MAGVATALRAASLAYLDTAPLIYVIEDHPTFAPLVFPLLHAIDRGEKRGVPSFLTLAEILVQPYRRRRADLAARYRELLLGSPNMRLLALDEAVAVEAARIRASYGVRLPDAVHLATAVTAEAEVFVTGDARLRRFREVRVVVLGDLIR